MRKEKQKKGERKKGRKETAEKMVKTKGLSRMAGMQKNEFVLLLSKHGIDIFQYTDEELQNEFALVDKIAEGAY